MQKGRSYDKASAKSSPVENMPRTTTPCERSPTILAKGPTKAAVWKGTGKPTKGPVARTGREKVAQPQSNDRDSRQPYR